MRIVIAGAGAIGGYIGARLAQAGADVVLFARGPHLRAMQERGLRVVSPDGDFEVRPQVTGDLATIGTADVVFLGVKAHGLTALAPQLASALRPGHRRRQHAERHPVVVLPGLRRRARRAAARARRSGRRHRRRRSSRERVVGSLAYFATDIAEPGVIHHTEGNRISFGEPDGTSSERCQGASPRR